MYSFYKLDSSRLLRRALDLTLIRLLTSLQCSAFRVLNCNGSQWASLGSDFGNLVLNKWDDSLIFRIARRNR